jgi:tetratricopeptide (TPR) repeat protein
MEESERSFRAALNVMPNDPASLFGLAAAVNEMGNILEAQRLYKEVIKYDTAHTCPRAHLELALIYQQRATPRKALPHLMRFRKLSTPGTPFFEEKDDLAAKVAIANLVASDRLRIVWRNPDPPFKHKSHAELFVVRGGAA